MKISVVVPVYNEVENLPLLYGELCTVAKEHSYDLEMLFADDGSKDGSRAYLKNLAQSDSRVKVIFFRRNVGQTAAMSAGFDFATGDVIIPMDGDMQNDPADIPKFLEKIQEGYDVVSGWRKDRQDKTLSRKIPSQIANRVISKIGGVPLHDYGCSMKAYKAEYVKGIKLYGEMHRFIPIYAKWEGAEVTEIPVNHRARQFGKSKYGINRTFKVIYDLLVIKFLERYFNKPIYIFGAASAFSLLFSLISFILMIYFKFWGGKTFVQTPLPAVSVTFFVVGVLSFILGLIAEMVTRTYYESQGTQPYKVKEAYNISAIEKAQKIANSGSNL